MNKHALRFTIIAITLVACACSEESNKCTGPDCCDPLCGESQTCYNNACINLSEHPDICVPECSEAQTCYKNQCIVLSEHPDICIPKCKGTKVCLNNQCVKIADHPEICIPKCGEGATCINNRCVDNTTVCTPACEGQQICENGHCVDLDPNACGGKLCRDDKTFCNDSGQWEECPADTGCHIGYCIKGLNKECEDDTCDNDNTHVCKDGVWIKCDAPAKCVEADESTECIIEDESCTSGACSENNHYFCNSNGLWESCGEGFECKNGVCEQTFDDDASLLWTLCQADSECSTGKCLKNIVTSRALTRIEKNINLLNDSIPVSMIDSRIPYNYGICSADCTQNPNVCEQISTDNVRYSCQLAIIGNSPYPPKDENFEDYPLPFAHVLNLNDMKTAPFGAICRPDDSLKLAFSDKFCNACDNSDQCGNGENCIYGECLPKCSVNTQCPLGFKCSEYSDTNEKYCMPPEGTCGICIDRDGDGQGYGHCTRTGFDCDDLNPNVSYTGQLPTACIDNSDDTNCNGMIDQYELLGTLDHCAKCGDSCHPVEDANIVRTCKQENPDIPIDTTTSDGIRDTFKYICHEECAVGYGDCDGDPLTGCETHLVEFSDDYLTVSAIQSGVIYAPDTDNDTYGAPDARKHVFCCPAKDENTPACYKLPNLNNIPEETTVFNWEPTDLSAQESGVVSITSDSFDKLSDCNDENSTVYPGAPEICDGLNNDCDPSSPDGKDDIYTLRYKDDTTFTSTLGEACLLYKDQPEDVGTPSCGEGKTACTLMSTSAFGMDCISDITSQMTEESICENNWNGLSEEARNTFCSNVCDINEETCLAQCQKAYKQSCLCNGIDDNCDGRIDEDWHFETCTLEDRVGICRMGILTCGQVKQSVPEMEEEWEVPSPVCQPLFYKSDGRGYDFFGDGVDSNCDGEDFDKSTALFVTPYFGTGSFEPHDDGKGEQQNVPRMGLYDAPYVSLKKALSVACTQSVEEGVKCRDILVNSKKGNKTYRDWQTEDLVIPVYNSKDVHRPEFYTHERTLADETKATVETWTHEEIVKEYERLWKEAFQYHGVDYETITISADTSKYLLEGEIYPKELIRIIGGMQMKEEVKDGKKIPVWTQSLTQTEYNVNITYDQKNANYTYDTNHIPVHVIIHPDNKQSKLDSMSLYLDSMQFSLTAKLNSISSLKAIQKSFAYNGITLIGLSCGTNGCRDLTFHNTEFSVTAPTGLSSNIEHLETQENGWKADGLTSITKTSNDIWNADVKKGYDGAWQQSDENQSEINRFTSNYDANRCLRPNAKSTTDKWTQEYTSWSNYYEQSASNFKGMCPDGVLPFGGCGGGVCTKDYCANLTGNATRGKGKSGWGSNGGAGGGSWTNKGDNCNEGTWCDDSYTGKSGKNGTAGKGGKVLNAFKSQELSTLVPQYRTSSTLIENTTTLVDAEFPHIYLKSNASLGDGEYGQSGGGGGGGGVCRAFTRTGPYNSRFIYAGGGGAGGCGGWQGHPGGTGGTAVGMYITPPARNNESLVITPDAAQSNNRFVFATGGAGGDGQNGQLGVIGADGGARRGEYDAGHCEVSAGGGKGGTGGSSGGGAAGAPGAAYAFIFACNREGYSESENPFAVLNDATVDPNTPNCGMEFKGSLGVSETEASYGKVQTASFGTDGTDAAATTTDKPGTYGIKGSSTGSERKSIIENGIEYKPNSGVYHYMYIN